MVVHAWHTAVGVKPLGQWAEVMIPWLWCKKGEATVMYTQVWHWVTLGGSLLWFSGSLLGTGLKSAHWTCYLPQQVLNGGNYRSALLNVDLCDHRVSLCPHLGYGLVMWDHPWIQGQWLHILFTFVKSSSIITLYTEYFLKNERHVGDLELFVMLSFSPLLLMSRWRCWACKQRLL